MEGLGEGYEAFVGSLQSDFAAVNVPKGSGQNGTANVASTSGSTVKRTPFPSHTPHSQMNQAKYVGYPSLANAFTVKRDESSFPLDSSVRGRHGYVDVSKEDIVVSSALMGVPHNYSSDLNQISDIPYRQRGHRRAQSESAFRLPDDIIFDYEPSLFGSSLAANELGDRLLEMNLNADKVASSAALIPFSGTNAGGAESTHLPYTSSLHHARSLSVDHVLADFGSNDDTFGFMEETWSEARGKPKHSHSNSMDGHSNPHKESSSSEASKAVSASKLAELALIDPKRAKRIIANRQSAARSKERKMRYIAELERKVQALQTDATALSAQLTIMKSDTTVLTQENSELKFQLQTLEQQTQQGNDLNRYLKEQVQRLKIATGEIGLGIGQFTSHDDHPLLSRTSSVEHNRR